MLKRIGKQAAVRGIHMAGPSLWPLLMHLPYIGRFAKALELHRNPFCMELPLSGTLLRWPLPIVMPTLPGRTGDDVPPAIIQQSAILDWSGKRVALIAHWDPKGKIAAYVRYYAQKLRDAGFAVILTSSDAVALPDDIAALPFHAIVYRDCPGYDFSSWKAALKIFPSLFLAEELLLTNDSIFGPVGDLAPLLESMQAVDCDFWGLIESHALAPHLQSFFLLFKRDALVHPAFREFWETVGTSQEKRDSIGYETRLSGWLAGHDLRGAARFPLSMFRPSTLNPSHYAWDSLLQTGQFPFVKRELLFQNPYTVPLAALRELLSNNAYPSPFIQEYADRNGLTPLQ